MDFIEGKSFLNLRMPAEYSKLFGNIDNAVASFLFDAPIDVTQQPKIADVLTTLKQRSKTLEDFRDKLYGVNGANTCLDNDILPTQFQLIGKPVPAGVRFPLALMSVKAAMAYAQEHSLEFLTSKGQALHSNGTITPITAENSVAYSDIGGLVENRGIFAVVAFEGVFNFITKAISTFESFHTCYDTLSAMSTLHCHPLISRRPKITTGGPWTTTTTSLDVSHSAY